MRIWPALSLAAVFAAGACNAQQDFHIAGTIVNSVTGEPIRGALVTAEAFGRHGVESPKAMSALTETGGAFRFSGVAAAEYHVAAQKPGFVQSSQGIRRTVKVGPSAEGIIVRLTPLAKIFGRVTDGDGEPLSRAAIRLYGSRMANGKRTPYRARSVVTDGSGRFRLWNLEPGEYYLLAAGRGGGTMLHLGHAATMPNSHESFAPVYNGGARDRASATPIVLAAGQEVETNFRVDLRTAHRVRGTIRNLRPYQPVEIELLRGGQDVSATRALVNAATGQFDLQGVVPGAYTLRASQTRGGEPLRAEQQIEVGEGDLNGLALAMAPQVEVVVKTEVRGVESRWARSNLSLETEDGENAAFGQPEADGTLKLSVFPGRYAVSVSGIGGYVVSATTGNVDLLSSKTLTVAAGAPPLIEVVLATDGGSIEATVPADLLDLGVLLVRSSDGYGQMTVRRRGLLVIYEGLAPGDYELYLVRNPDQLEYRNAAVIKGLGRGVPVRVEKGATAKVAIQEVVR